MTLLSICSGLAKNVGIAAPTSIVGNSDRTWQEALQFANETGEEIARRIDWGKLTASATLTGDGTNKVHSLPNDFGRLAQGIAVKATGIVRPLTRAEWNALTPVSGTPRYFLLQDAKITLWPYLANAQTASVSYQSDNWVGLTAPAFTADDQTPVFSEDLFLKGLIVRWRRQKGMPYQDEEAEYEASMADFAKFDDRGRF